MEISSTTSPAMSVIAVKQAATQVSAQFKIMKKQHDMQMELINMIANATQKAPDLAGHGTKVDKTA